MTVLWADNRGGKLERKRRRLSALIEEIDKVRQTVPDHLVPWHPTLDKLYKNADILIREINLMKR